MDAAAGGPNVSVAKGLPQPLMSGARRTAAHGRRSGLHASCAGLYALRAGLHAPCEGLYALRTGLYARRAGLHAPCTGLYALCAGLHARCAWLTRLVRGAETARSRRSKRRSRVRPGRL